MAWLGSGMSWRSWWSTFMCWGRGVLRSLCGRRLKSQRMAAGLRLITFVCFYSRIGWSDLFTTPSCLCSILTAFLSFNPTTVNLVITFTVWAFFWGCGAHRSLTPGQSCKTSRNSANSRRCICVAQEQQESQGRYMQGRPLESLAWVMRNTDRCLNGHGEAHQMSLMSGFVTSLWITGACHRMDAT